MKLFARTIIAKSQALLLALMLALLVPLGGAHAQGAQDRPPFSQQQLEQMLAPIALYPDPLLSQILMAATYPLEVVEAARWSRSHSHLTGEDAVRAAQNENWDPSVKSMLAFPQILARMDENLQWLQDLGDAFLAQEPHVMETVQHLRRKAWIAGNLRSDERQRIVETGPLLAIVPANPQYVYVPYYDPWVVYGPWWWPGYAPVYWRPFPGYYMRPGLASSFYWGPSIRISVGYFFGGFDWPRRQITVVHNHYYYGAVANQSTATISSDRPRGTWQHNPDHRRGIAYRGAEVQQRFSGSSTSPDSGNYRPREDARRQDQSPAPSSPTINRRSESGRPAVQAERQWTGPSKAEPLIQQGAQPNPRANRQGDAPMDARQTDTRQSAVPQTRDTRGQETRGQERRAQETSAQDPRRHDPRRQESRAQESRAQESRPQPATQPAPVTQPQSGPNASAERRNQVKDDDRGDRRESVESRQATRPPSALVQPQRNRGNAPPSPGEQAERSPRPPPHANAPKHEPRSSPASRQEAPRGVERQKEVQKEVQGKSEARPDSGRHRGANSEKAEKDERASSR